MLSTKAKYIRIDILNKIDDVTQEIESKFHSITEKLVFSIEDKQISASIFN